MPTPAEFLRDTIDPGLAWLAQLGGPPPSDAARRMLLAIALQESGPTLEARYQNHPSTAAGAAKGFFQFESGGGVAGVMSHPATRVHAQNATKAASVAHHQAAIHRALEGHDNLAVAFARLLLWSDPAPLPTTESDGWACYMRLWRPGRPHQDRWPSNWRAATEAVNAQRS